MKKTLLISAMFAAACITGAASAQSAYYTGAGVGQSESRFTSSATIQDTGTSYTAYLGHDYTKNFGAEVGYSRFFYVQTKTLGVQQEAVTVQGTAHLAIAKNVTIFAKGGVAYSRNVDSKGGASDAFAPVAAVGIDYALTSVMSIRAEQQYIHKFADLRNNVSNTSIGLKLAF
ncbi:MAG: outer membrane beta-barrel protein [Agitococcus sp.]|nr:outer membrane beta-barrel protein [Agitococcus sp.]MDO9179195.1 outer membrane beta-barrel protein [Agitococcus sp.]